MRSTQQAALRTVRGEMVVLEAVRIETEINDLTATVSTSQQYRNPGTDHIEVVYTFPMPAEAVLLDFEIELSERKLTATVVPKSEAEERYEDTVTDGDAAVMLEQPQPGLYTANVGNLAPGESVVLGFRYGLLLRWNGTDVRFSLPTTIAPRYGDPSAAGLLPHQTPSATFDSGPSLDVAVVVRGALRQTRWTSPSHTIAIESCDGRTDIQIAHPVSMDRDIVLCANAPEVAGSQAQLARDGDGWVVHASFRPDVLDRNPSTEPHNFKIVVDCSGSMGGDAIAQVRIAGERILDSLRPADLFDIIAFGSSHRTLFGRTMPATPAHVDTARDFVRGLDADMGGTEIAGALRMAYDMPCETGIQRDLLLITDGEVWDAAAAIDEARRSGHRVFAVGVGSAAVEPFVSALAEATGGACELVVPRDDMAARIHRHFQRILGAGARSAAVRWPTTPSHTVPESLPPPYAGDTMHIFGWFDDMPEGDAVVELSLADGHTVSQRIKIGTAAPGSDIAALSDIARLGAARRLANVREPAEGTALATHYRLMCEWTHYLAVAVRADADKGTDLPTLVKVPQVVAAGWHGTGTVLESPKRVAAAYLGRETHRAPAAERIEPNDRTLGAACSRAPVEPRVPSAPPATPLHSDPEDLVMALRTHPLPTTPIIDDLRALGLPATVVLMLQEAIDDCGESEAILFAFLHLLCTSEAGRVLDRAQRRRVRSAHKRLPLDAAAKEAVRRAFELWQSEA